MTLSLHPNTPGTAPAPWRRRDGLLALGAVLIAHTLLLADALPGLRAGAAVQPVRPALVVRQVTVPAAQAAQAMPARPPDTPVPAPARARAGPRKPAPPVDPQPLPQTSAVPPAPEVQPAAPQTSPEPVPDVPAAARAEETEAPPPAPSTDTEGIAPTAYPTRTPAPARLQYTLQRGALTGSAEMSWAPDGETYELALRGTVLGVEVIDLLSRGAFDAAGLAPERFADRRRGRERRAANFDRAAGRITYSGPAVTYPLLPGAQDRLSWMLQLPAIIDADPQRWTSGTRVSIFVTGARGDADLWTFSMHAPETVDVPAGRVENALRVTREPRKPFDTQVEIWLDPARQHLPVRARLTTLPGGDTLELALAP